MASPTRKPQNPRTFTRAVYLGPTSSAPEATYQVWMAQALIAQFGPSRVAREPNFRHKRFTSPWTADVPGSTVFLDAVVTTTDGIDMPHWVRREDPERGGIGLVGRLAVVSELKVGASTLDGLKHGSVRQDFAKLSMLLDEAERQKVTIPLAYMCVLDNHASKRYRFATLERDLHRYDARISLLRHTVNP
ncbi:MAG: hypothetical protein ACR2N7_06210 [Acidimicrobiia bacterium]